MKLAIMQPYFLPYTGYFQLIHATKKFVIHDDIQYTKKGWINRNRFLIHDQVNNFSINLNKSSHKTDIVNKVISPVFKRKKLTSKLYSAYRLAPQFRSVFPLVEEIIFFEDNLLVNYVENSIKTICLFLDINVDFTRTSQIDFNNNLTGKDRVVEICNAMRAETYINLPGGIELYDKSTFNKANINLRFINPEVYEYKQFHNSFVPNLSIIDAMMFNKRKSLIQFCKTGYEII
jgi:hypothetical protein